MMKNLLKVCITLLVIILSAALPAYADDVPTPPSPPTPPDAPLPPCVPVPGVPSTPPSPPGPPTSSPSEPSTPSSPSGTPCPSGDNDDDDGDDDDGDDDTGGGGGSGTTTPPTSTSTPPTPPSSTSGSGGGGGSSGGGGGSGYAGGGGLVTGQVLGASTCAPYLLEYIWSKPPKSLNNNPSEILKLQQFLNDHQHSALTLNGKYDSMTQGALGWFQIANGPMILQPWINIGEHRSVYVPTFNVYKTTKWWINKLKCAESEPPTHPALP